jgi:phosphoserine phosphatase RsbU/P
LSTKRPIFLYILLAGLFAITLVYQGRYIPDFLSRERVNVPFFQVRPGTDRVFMASRNTVTSGIRNGDALVAINGVPFSGTAQLARAFNEAQPGSALTVTLVPADAPGSQRTVSLPATREEFRSWDVISDLVVGLLLPAVSLLLGFWVAFRRPSDPLAWLLLGVMLSFPHILSSFIVYGWPPGWREAAVLYETVLEFAFPIILFLFGRFFPEPFAAGSRHDRIWRILQWTVALPFGLLSIASIVLTIGSLNNYRTVEALHRTLSPLDPVVYTFQFVLISSFFTAMGIRLGSTTSPDAKRRLAFLYWGAIAAFIPAALPTLFARLQGKAPNEIFPAWFMAMILIPLVLFPLTLSYVIVVQKAMGVGVALRQGLQYALARGGVRILQVAALLTILFAGTTMMADARHDLVQKIIVLLVGITAYFTIHRLGGRLQTWIDRRFFRETYDAEHVLTELSEQVRSMVEPKALVKTVAARISETLHVPQVVVLLGGGGHYQPAFAMGYDVSPTVMFTGKSGTAQVLKQQREPARVFLNDRDSWVYREQGVDDEDRRKLAVLQSELLLPLSVRDKMLGFISLGSKRSEEPYTRSDVRLLQSVATQTGLALENANLLQTIAEEVAHRERLNREVEIAREVQERLFPQKLPAIAGVDYCGHCRPALGVGGDYYDFLALPGSGLGIAIGDVSGKGIGAALMMASLQASLRGEATRAPKNLAAVVANVNRLVYEASAANRYATFFYGQYDSAQGDFHYVNAGHNPPILFRGDEIIRLEAGGTVVGLVEGAQYEEGIVRIQPGDILVAFTDGISEAMNPEDEEWGEDRLIATVRRATHKTARELLDQIFDAATRFAGTAPQHDDMTLVVFIAHAA